MIFKLVWGNHWNFGLPVSDTMLIVKKSIELLGHRVDLERNISPGYINLILENFNQEQVKQIQQAFKENKTTSLILLASEPIFNSQLNGFCTENDDSYYTDKSYWKTRMENMVQVEKLAFAIWHLGDYCVPQYKSFFCHDRVYYFPHHYLDGMKTVEPIADNKKDIDILFTGCLTNHRKTVLDKFKLEGLNVVYEHSLLAPFYRENLVARSKISVNIRQHEQWPYPSTSRFFYHLINDALMVTEYFDIQSDTQPYVITAKSEKFFETCIDTLNQGDYNCRAISFRELFALECPMRKAISRLLDLTFNYKK